MPRGTRMVSQGWAMWIGRRSLARWLVIIEVRASSWPFEKRTRVDSAVQSCIQTMGSLSHPVMSLSFADDNHQCSQDHS